MCYGLVLPHSIAPAALAVLWGVRCGAEGLGFHPKPRKGHRPLTRFRCGGGGVCFL